MHELLELIRSKNLATGNFLGFLHVLIGRTITSPHGVVISHGLTFRDLSLWLKKLRWVPEDARELGLNPDTLPIRDRQRYWFVAMCQAHVDSAAAQEAGDRFAVKLKKEGYVVAAHRSA